MADGLLDHPLATRLLEAAADAGLDLGAALGSGDDDLLRATELAQPALFLVGVVLADLLGAAPGLEVVGTAGHSVGEYAALVAAGVLDPVVAMRLVVARGRAMAQAPEGTMAAVLGLDVGAVEAVCATVAAEGLGLVVVANVNAPDQVVVSGTVAAVDRALALARGQGARRAVPLRVSGAFHSPLMRAAAETVARLVDAAPMADPRIPVALNVDGALARSAAEVRQRLRHQLLSPVRWDRCVGALVGLGVDVLVELGPKGVLTGLARRLAPQVPATAVATPQDLATVAEVAAQGARGPRG